MTAECFSSGPKSIKVDLQNLGKGGYVNNNLLLITGA